MFTFSSVLVPPQWQFRGALRNPKKNLLLYLDLSPALLFEECCRVGGRSQEESLTLHRFSLLILAGTSRPLVLNVLNAMTL